jgi:glycerol-3-phosphate acyltransferase PlsX
MRIGIDIMGGDFFPNAPISGIVAARNSGALSTDVELVLIGEEVLIQTHLREIGIHTTAYEIVHAPEQILMEEHPAKALQSKPNSSISIGIKLLKLGKLDAFISAGNTGAMLVASVVGLGLIEGVLRPTVGGWFPYREHRSLLCDVGANLECKPEMLWQFGLLGSIAMQVLRKVEKPRVGLLNVGEERTKGTEVHQKAYQLLEADNRIHFVGNVEGRDINRFAADVYVCDGFTGNILYKYGESLYDLFKPKLPNDPDIDGYSFENVGALPILGVQGTVMVAHGISNAKAYHNMIFQTIEIVRSGLPNAIAQALATVKN